MNISRTFRFLLILIPVLAACSQMAPTTYTTVSEGTLKPGNVVPAPTGDVVLTIDGKISQTNSGNTLKFDMPTLESIGVVKYEVNDPFAKMKVTYSSVLFSQILKVAAADARGANLTFQKIGDVYTDNQNMRSEQ